ncbi:uncharacterized protein PV07_02057 [Cladophialophora immunda]|uniref:NB-ARC domain-containing protein n=1 Tax=Cladophialophora immunda TaxID=569365 RepID=A0A0D2CW82_9EURO|nr:uncharacterized protein PV07_02057 [Cladophialophora immunda]KIW35358.1 hypothetical protein PV07_02057 [Cladophialophora immunda]
MVLRVVYRAQGPTTSSSIDVVAVHGLGGDLVNTWTHPKSKKFWLQDFLPLQIPDARVLTFGYNADAAFGQSTGEIVDHAKSLLSSLVDKREEQDEIQRPLVFVAHSLGGIVVKQALFQAKLEPRYESIRDATVGLIFLGTPHRGSGKATYGKVLASVAQFVSHHPPPRLLTALQTNSDALFRLTTDFRFQVPDYQVYSFYEQRSMPGFSSLIVEKNSALLEVHHEEQIPVDADHSAMCKFETEDDDTFEKIYKRIRRMRDSPRYTTMHDLVSNNSYFLVPHLLSTFFTGREDELRSLSAAFAGRHPLQGHHQRRFVLFGLGGSGKTQICLSYVQSHRERYWGIFWVDASSDDRLQQDFAQIAQLLQVDETVDCVKRRLANAAQTWLLVLDNADDPDLSLSPYLPAGNRGDIIITSRNPTCQQYNTVGYRHVRQLSSDDSVSLLNKIIYGSSNSSELDTHLLQEIVETLGCLALAIVQAGAYIRETSCSLYKYLEIYQSRKTSILQRVPKHVATGYQYSVYATWQLSADMIQSREEAVPCYATRILKLLGFLHHDRVSLQMFYTNGCRSQGSRFLGYLPFRKEASEPFDYQRLVQLSFGLLASFSLITTNQDTSVSLHPLVHEWCRDRMTNEEQHSSYRLALSLLTCSTEWEDSSESYQSRRALVPHIQELLGLKDLVGDLSEAEKLQTWPYLALILSENGLATQAIDLTTEMLKIAQSVLGESGSWTLWLMKALADQYRKAGRREEALRLAQEVSERYKTSLGLDDSRTIGSLNCLANCYSDTGQHAEALHLTEEVVRLLKIKLGESHKDTLGAMQNLAIHYSRAGREMEALKLTEEVLEHRKGKFGQDHPQTLASMQILANQWYKVGRRGDALQLTEEVVKRRADKLGFDHPDTLASTAELAQLYRQAGRQAEAMRLMEELRGLLKVKLGDDHPDTLASMEFLASNVDEGETKHLKPQSSHGLRKGGNLVRKLFRLKLIAGPP